MKKHLLLSITILGLISLGSVACIKKELIEPTKVYAQLRTATIDHLERIKNLLFTSPTTVKIAMVGDSTSDLLSNANPVRTYIATYTNNPDEPIYGFNRATNLLDFGYSGRRLLNWNARPADPKGLNELIVANPDLIIFSFGINDVRVNAVTKDQLKVMLVKAIDTLILKLPNADIILRMPNIFCMNPVFTVNYVQQGSYPTLNDAAQAQCDILYNAYMEVFSENTARWDHVELFNSQDLIFGHDVVNVDPALFGNQIHPRYDKIVAEIVKMIGHYETYSQFKADSAYALDSIQPWLHYNQALNDSTHFDKIYVANANSVGATKMDFNIPPSIALTGVHQGDIVSVCNTFFFEVNGTLSTVNATRTRLTQTLSAHPELAGGNLYFYRRK